MKKIKNIYTIVATTVMLMGLPTLYLYAGSSLDKEIAKIKSAPPKERVRLMNELKKRIFSLNQAQRIKAIRKLRRYIASAPKHSRVVHKKSYKSRVVSSSLVTTHQNIDTSTMVHRVEMMNHHSISSMVHEMGVPTNRHKDIVTKMIEQNIAKAPTVSSVEQTQITHTEIVISTSEPVEHTSSSTNTVQNDASKMLSEASKISQNSEQENSMNNVNNQISHKVANSSPKDNSMPTPVEQEPVYHSPIKKEEVYKTTPIVEQEPPQHSPIREDKVYKPTPTLEQEHSYQERPTNDNSLHQGPSSSVEPTHESSSAQSHSSVGESSVSRGRR